MLDSEQKFTGTGYAFTALISMICIFCPAVWIALHPAGYDVLPLAIAGGLLSLVFARPDLSSAGLRIPAPAFAAIK